MPCNHSRPILGLCLFCVLCGLCFRPLKKRPKKLEEDTEGGEEAGDKEKSGNCVRTIMDQSCSPKLLTNLPFMLLCFSNLFATQAGRYCAENLPEIGAL